MIDELIVCDQRGWCHMTEQFQWTSMAIVIGVVILVVLGVASLFDREKRIRDLQWDLEESANHWYEDRDSHAEPLPGHVERKQFKLESTISGQLISPSGLRWLERKLGL